MLLLAALGPACSRKSPETAAPPATPFRLPACEGRVLLGPDLRLTRAATPALAPGPAGSWDGVDVMNPTVIERDSRMLMLYSGFDGRLWRTGLAISADGLRWDKRPKPVLEPSPSGWDSEYIAANGTALLYNGKFYYWYQAGRDDRVRIGLATSQDGGTWTKRPEPVLRAGAPGAWDSEAVADPFVLLCGNTLVLYYLGQDANHVQRLGIASSPDGVRWTKYPKNPVLDVTPDSFDARGLGEPAVIPVSGGLAMFYTGRDAREFRRIGMALSSDGLAWRKSGIVLDVARSGWDSRVVADPHATIGGGRLFLWYGGGNVASPDEKLHGHIGLATARLEYGFRLNYEQAKVRPEDNRPDTPNQRWAFPYRDASLVTLAHAGLVFNIGVPPNARLRADVRMVLPNADPAKAVVRVNQEEVFSKLLAPAGNSAASVSERSAAGIAIDVDLSRFAGQHVEVELAALPGPRGERAAWVGWRNPRIVTMK